MSLTEPNATALLLAGIGVLLGLSVLLSRLSGRAGVPLALIFLVVGMIAGSDGLGGIQFDDYGFAFRLGTAALVLILFDGGLNTSLGTLRSALAPAAVLATFAVAGTAALVALAGIALGLPWTQAALLGAVVSSTDAAAVFAVLRGSGLQLNRRIAATLELESGSNDPMAFVLTTSLTAIVTGQQEVGWQLLFLAPLQLAIGALAGVLIGFGARHLLMHLRLPAGGLFPVLTLAFALVAFGLPTLVYGSGFLAVYVAGMVLGGGRIPYRSGILRVHDALAWLSQVSMFLLLGLLVFPSRLLAVAGLGTAIALFLAFVARPLMTALCLLPFRFTPRETLYMGWVGLRGAVPIILATYPILMGVPDAHVVFDLVFFVVVVNTAIPGATVRWVTERLGLRSVEPPPPPASIEVNTTSALGGEVTWFYVDQVSAVSGSLIADIPFPPESIALLLLRADHIHAPKGGTRLQPGDYVCVFHKPEDYQQIALWFGRTA